ncbi:MAG: HAMP domain-containing histidine kinase [Gammaproteobacteria bacterium]|nr:HAMP domain-containing histidine kinase [Gammaproteobacteria bacterium]
MTTDSSRDHFGAILSSSIHDTKSSIAIVLLSLERMIIDLRNQQVVQTPATTLAQLGTINYQAQRINDHLMQLLALYRIEKEGFKPQIQEIYMSEFLEDCTTMIAPLAEMRGITLTLEAPAGLYGYFDPHLVSMVAHSMLSGAIIYCQSHLRLSVHAEQNGMIAIRLEDDGKGFPAAILGKRQPSLEELEGVSFTGGNLGLAIYFARLVAELHLNQGLQGGIALANQSSLGGGIFTIYLP